jgi:malonate transporter MadL subunit
MVIYGVALLAVCYLVGIVVGDLLGRWVGVDANVGGVGIAMLLLLGLTSYFDKKVPLPTLTASGVSFWSAMYIPIVIAMAAKQNVLGAMSGGWMAIIAGVAAVMASFALIPVLTRWSRRGDAHD